MKKILINLLLFVSILFSIIFMFFTTGILKEILCLVVFALILVQIEKNTIFKNSKKDLGRLK